MDKKETPIWKREPISLNLGHMTPEEIAKALLKKPSTPPKSG